MKILSKPIGSGPTGAQRSLLGRADELEAFEVRSSDGAILRARPTDGLLISKTHDTSDATLDIALIRFAGQPHLAFLVAVGTQVDIGARFEPLHSPVLSYRLLRHGGGICLRHPLAELYACAIPQSYASSSPIEVNREGVGGWEVFNVVVRTSPDLDVGIREDFVSIEPVLRSNLSSEAVLKWLQVSSKERVRTIGQALLRLASPDTISAVAEEALRSPPIAEKLASLTCRAPSLTPAVAELAQWVRTRSVRARVRVGPEHDDLATTVREGSANADLPVHLLGAARRCVEPTKMMSVLATVRSEGPYLVDWIAYHRAIGINHFFLYSSDNDDESDELLDCLAAAGAVTHLAITSGKGVVKQDKAYSHALLAVPELLDYRWTAIIDLDEYIVVDPTTFPSLQAFLELQEARGADAVSLNWRGFGSDGLASYVDKPVFERITGCEPHPNPFVKTISRTNRIWSARPHMAIWSDRNRGLAVDAFGRPHFSRGLIGGPGSQRHSDVVGPAWINHYYSKTFPESVWKFARDSVQSTTVGRPRFNNVFIAGFLHDFDGHNQVQDRTILAYAGTARRERDRLMSLPGVADAHARTVHAFCNRVGALVRDIPNHAEQIPEPVRDDYLHLVTRSIAEGIARP